ncbi:hypothetical protein [Dietzia maris]|uniref:Uncharacterized protein n=1 Tax=Dietzia maris TaxID=37915 RepID=A0ABT8H4V2_9ACTN|nr:hypothetical protein [Dietzia maris]MDN4507492.1 hypothetical protein [Dietzia maris]
MPKAFPKEFREDVIRVFRDSDSSVAQWQIGPVGTPSPAIRYFDSGDSVLLGAGGVVCSG